MKPPIAIAFMAALASPTVAQSDGVPLIRVYIDQPYFYEILAFADGDQTGPSHTLKLLVEGKEVGASDIVLDCESGDYVETVTDEWTGNSADYVLAALMAYRNLFCGV